MRVVAVKFKDNSNVYNSVEYYYKTTFHVSYGDEVVVYDPDTMIGSRLQVAMISCAYVEDPRLKKLAKDYLVQRIDKTEYIKAVDNDLRLQSIKEEIAYLMSDIDNEKLSTVLEEYAREIKELSK